MHRLFLLVLAMTGISAVAADKAGHWAFQPLRDSAPPLVKNEAWVKSPIDRFILARREAAEPALPLMPMADARALARRLSFDLTGLPPSEELIQDLRSDEPNAVEEALDRLLASPSYGERWGRHWLDVARYSDTKGYVYGREERFFVHSHAYRDWVVRAFREDLPYDRFLLLQIAADQLVAPDAPDLAAMGFVTGGRRFLGVTHDIIDDRIDVVTRGTMALTVQCARCHDHKFDPIPTQDYYSLYGVFRGGDDQLVRVGPAVEDAKLKEASDKFAAKMREQLDAASDRLRARVGDYLAAQLEMHQYPEEGFDQLLTATDIIPTSVRYWRDFLIQSRRSIHPIFAVWNALAEIPAKEFTARAASALEHLRREHGDAVDPAVMRAFVETPSTMKDVAARYGQVFAQAAEPGNEALRAFLRDPKSPTTVPDSGLVNNEFFFPTRVTEELWKLQGDVDRRLLAMPNAPAYALIVRDGEAEPNPRVFERGSAARLGEEVPRRFLRLLAGESRSPFSHGNGRLDLAQDIVHPKNPLTARVMVNRLWQWHFGTGLVRTASDFGLRAEAPSHPELLDWLAKRFIESGWSVKVMHRLICGSAVYQQASAGEPSASDPDNRLLSYFPRQRLDFEQTRDAMLSASGELDGRIGGRASELMTAENRRRTIYGIVDRQFLPGVFRTFDFANPDLHVATRHETTVPQQALFFLNNAFAANRARSLIALPEISAAAEGERIGQIYRRVLRRTPRERETEAARRFLHEAKGEKAELNPWEQFAQVLLLSNEFAFVD